MSSSHYIKHRNIILSNEIQENKNGQQSCIQVQDQKRKEKAPTFHRQLFCHCLQVATTLGAVDHEKEGRMRNCRYSKYTEAEANILNKAKTMVDLHELSTKTNRKLIRTWCKQQKQKQKQNKQVKYL